MKAWFTTIVNNGGATLTRDLESANYATGWQVSKQDLFIIPMNTLPRSKQGRIAMAKVKNLIARIAKTHIKSKQEFLGLWIDNGKLYIDKSVRTKTKKEAMQIAHDNKQLAIFKWATKSSVMVEG
jgi:hypothetical protein